MPKHSIHYFPNQGDVVPDFQVGEPITIYGHQATIVQMRGDNKVLVQFEKDDEVHLVRYRIHERGMPDS